jgi:5-(carboxyamino)imidazole ribonucleotide synthase
VRIGIVGGGQLGRMLGLAGVPLGMRLTVLDPAPDAPAAAVADHIVAEYEDEAALEELARASDIVTYECENVPVDAARSLARSVPVHPPPNALAASQDRLVEKAAFERAGIPVGAYAPAENEDEVRGALERVGVPAVVKARRFGYDGKGQAMVRSVEEVAPAWRAVARPAIVEARVPFDRELSILGVRAAGGELRCYPLVENRHRDGILRRSVSPAPRVTVDLQAQAERHLRRVADDLEYVGVLAIELFEVDGGLLGNEMAPRVHNSGHWTIEGSQTSQFENHLRAVAGLPLGSTAPRGVAAMLNLIGTVPDADQILAVPGAHLHLYGKSPRRGRKLGHVTLVADDHGDLQARIERVAALVH